MCVCLGGAPSTSKQTMISTTSGLSDKDVPVTSSKSRHAGGGGGGGGGGGCRLTQAYVAIGFIKVEITRARTRSDRNSWSARARPGSF